jgi:hypothetical protein
MIVELVGVFFGGGALLMGFYALMKDNALGIQNGDASFEQKAGFFYFPIMTIVCVVGFFIAWAMGAF